MLVGNNFVTVGNAPVVNGSATLLQSIAGAAPTTWIAVFQPSNGNISGSISAAVTVTPVTVPTQTTVSANPNPSVSGGSVTFTATVTPSGTTGHVFFISDGVKTVGDETLSSGTASVSTSTLAAGTHTIMASYTGDTDYSASSATVSLTVNPPAKTATATSLSVTPNPGTTGQSVTFTATVSPAAATGTVTFSEGATNFAAMNLSNGTAAFSTSVLTAGGHTVTASYSGDSSYNSSSGTVSLTIASPAMTVTATSLSSSPNPSSPGQTVMLMAAVTPSTATGSVTFSDGNSTLGAVNLSNGTAAFSTSMLSVGVHSLTASYGGDSSDNGSTSSTVMQTVSAPGKTATTTSLSAVPNPAAAGQNVLLTATVSPAAATGAVTFSDGATTLATVSLSNGTASLSTGQLAAGGHTLTASYGGDANYAGSAAAAVSLTVSGGAAATTTSLAVSPLSPAVGQNVTLTATVSPPAATGNVTFQDGGTTLGTAGLSAGTAVFHTPSLSAGAHTLTAVYLGDGNFASSTAAGVAVTVSSTSPVPVSVTPAAGSGSGPEAFTFDFSDPAGYQSLGVVNILVNNFLNGRHACYLAYVVATSTLVLVDDGGDAGGPYAGSVAVGSGASIQNSQCTVHLISAAGTENTLELKLNISFSAGFGGNRIVYLAARDQGAGNSDWQALGVWQAPFTPAGTIAVSSVTASRGSGVAGTGQPIVFVLTDSQGAGDFGVVNVLVNNFIDARHACYLAYVASSNTLILVDDGGDAAGPYAGSMTLNGGASTIQNGQCLVSGLGSLAVQSGNSLTLLVNVTFEAGLIGNRVVWVAGRDAAGGNNTDWQALATWTVQ